MPEPGDLDADLENLDDVEIEVSEGSPDARVTVIEEAREERPAPTDR